MIEPHGSTPPLRLEAYRAYLRLLAQVQLPKELQTKVDPSDIVQETLLRAHERWSQFRGNSAEELGGWLRAILANRLTDAVRRFGADKRNSDLERSLEKALEDSSARLEKLLATDGRTPQEQCIHQEDLVRLSGALAQLPDEQRRAVEWRYLHGCAIAEISKLLDRSPTAVGGLLRRGMKQLRETLMRA